MKKVVLLILVLFGFQGQAQAQAQAIVVYGEWYLLTCCWPQYCYCGPAVPFPALEGVPPQPVPLLVPPPPQPPLPTLPPPPEPSQTFFQTPVQIKDKWGLTTSSLLGKFSSSPINGLVSRLTDRDICSVDGRAFDVGIARSRSGSSFWRLTFTGNIIEDKSYTRYFCSDCNTHITNAAREMRIWGGKIERIQRIGFGGQVIRPMITLHVGLGGVTGTSIRTIQRSDGLLKEEEVGARELFSSNLFPIVGAGVGFAGDIGERFTYGVTIVGVQYPGVYYGGVMLTYWP